MQLNLLNRNYESPIVIEGAQSVNLTNFDLHFALTKVRPVHGLVWVGFVPNSKPTRPDRMARISTRHRPEWLIGSGESHLQCMAVGSVRVGDLKIGKNPTS